MCSLLVRRNIRIYGFKFFIVNILSSHLNCPMLFRPRPVYPLKKKFRMMHPLDEASQ
jgi:hypothetical protein